MTTENSQKSKKYVVTKLVRDYQNHNSMTEKQLCRFDTLQECAYYIVSKNEYWHNCRYGKQNLTMELCDFIIKLKNLQKRSNSLKSDFQ